MAVIENGMESPEAQTALVEALRAQMMDRVRAQEQLVVASAAIGGAAASFGSDFLESHSEILAFLAALFATLLLAMLRQDEEITNIAAHLKDETAFGDHARAQLRWEQHKFRSMQRSAPDVRVLTATNVVGIYGIPALAYVACLILALISDGVLWRTLLILAFSGVLITIFGRGAVIVLARYRALGGTPPPF